MRAVWLDAQGDITPTGAGATNLGVAWQQENKGNYMQTPIVIGNLLYSCFDNGVVTCFDARPGTIRYNERLGNGSEGFTASPVSDGRNLYLTSEVGNVYVVPANGKGASQISSRDSFRPFFVVKDIEYYILSS